MVILTNLILLKEYKYYFDNSGRIHLKNRMVRDADYLNM